MARASPCGSTKSTQPIFKDDTRHAVVITKSTQPIFKDDTRHAVVKLCVSLSQPQAKTTKSVLIYMSIYGYIEKQKKDFYIYIYIYRSIDLKYLKIKISDFKILDFILRFLKSKGQRVKRDLLPPHHHSSIPRSIEPSPKVLGGGRGFTRDASRRRLSQAERRA